MARIRTVKPEFFAHPEVAACSVPARLLLLSLLTQADDVGRMYDQPRKILGMAFGESDRVKIEALLRELADRSRICRYEVEGKACVHVLNFNKHQSISRPSRSVIPPCPLHESSMSPNGELRDGSMQEVEVEVEVEVEQGKEQGTGNNLVGAPRPTRVRQPDEEWEAFCEVTNVNWHDLTADRRSALNGMLSSLRRRGADAGEIRRRAANWAWDVALTPEGLTKRWAELDTARPSRRQPYETPADEAIRRAREEQHRAITS